MQSAVVPYLTVLSEGPLSDHPDTASPTGANFEYKEIYRAKANRRASKANAREDAGVSHPDAAVASSARTGGRIASAAGFRSFS